MPLKCHYVLLAAFAAAAVGLAVPDSTAFADGIEAGLWKITTTIESGGMVSPPRKSSKCLNADQVANLAVTFSPVATTINSECAPMERSFDGKELKWHLVCKGDLDMELTGDFVFDSPHHYSGSVQTKASMAGQPMPESKNTVDADWVSACTQ
jgi:hypothetical protein